MLSNHNILVATKYFVVTDEYFSWVSRVSWIWTNCHLLGCVRGIVVTAKYSAGVSKKSVSWGNRM